MIAYNNTWLRNNIIHAHTHDALLDSVITAEESINIKEKYPVGFYTPNIFIRVGLFILTVIIAFFSYGLLTLMMANALSEKSIAAIVIFYGLLTYAALAGMTKSKHHYQSGVDDALLWMSAGMVFGGISYATDASPLVMCVTAFIISLLATLRFTDRAMAVIAMLSFMGIFFFTCTRMGGVAEAVVPFVLMVLSAVIYFAVKKAGKSPASALYTPCLKMVEIAALLMLYVSGNYFVVRELSDAMFDLNLPPDATIPFGWLFWIFTFFIPAIYLLQGIRLKDAVLLRVGLVLFAAIVFTVRYYHTVAPIEVAMTFGGLLLIGISYALIRWLKQPKFGFTYEELRPAGADAPIQIESLIIAETFSAPQGSPNATEFGGGSFGGGGASGEF